MALDPTTPTITLSQSIGPDGTPGPDAPGAPGAPVPTDLVASTAVDQGGGGGAPTGEVPEAAVPNPQATTEEPVLNEPGEDFDMSDPNFQKGQDVLDLGNGVQIAGIGDALRGLWNMVKGQPPTAGPQTIQNAAKKGGAKKIYKTPEGTYPPPDAETQALMAMTKEEVDRALSEGAIEAQRRGVRPRDLTMQLGEEISRTMTPDDVARIPPGTAMNAENAFAVVAYMNKSAERVWNMSPIARMGLQRGDYSQFQELLKQVAQHANLDPKRLGVMAETGRTLNILADPANTMNQNLARMQRLLQIAAKKNFTPEQFLDLIDSFKDSPVGLAVFADSLVNPHWGDAILEYWMNALLSGPITHATNFVSNNLQAALLPIENIMGVPFFKGNKKDYFASQGAMYVGLVEGIRDGWTAAKLVIKHGDDLGMMYGSKVEARRPAITPELLGLKQDDPGYAMFQALGQTVRIPTRMLTASDEFTKGMLRRMSIRHDARMFAAQEADNAGLTGARRDAFIRDRYQQLSAQPTDTMMVRARDHAIWNTLQEAMGARGVGAVMMLEQNPYLRFIQPFIMVPTNIMKHQLYRSPMGLLPGKTPFLDRLMPDLHARLTHSDPWIRAEARGRAMLGSSMVMMGSSLVLAGQLTGTRPKDKSLQKLQREMDVPPQSLNIPGIGWVDVDRLGVYGQIMKLSADVTLGLLAARTQEDFEMWSGAFSILAAAIAKDSLTPSFMAGSAQFFDMMYNTDVTPARRRSIRQAIGLLPEGVDAKEKSSAAFDRWVQNIGGSFVPAFLDQTNKMLADPVYREVDTLWEKMKSRTYGLSYSLEPQLAIIGGHEVFHDLSLYARVAGKPDPQQSQTPGKLLLERYGVGLSSPGDFIVQNMVTEVKLEQSEINWIIRRANSIKGYKGMTLVETLDYFAEGKDDRFNKLENAPLGRTHMLESTIQFFYQQAKADFIKNHKQVQEKIDNFRKLHKKLMTGVE